MTDERHRPATGIVLGAWGLVLGVAALVGLALFCLTVTSISLITVTIGIPATVLAAAAVRGYAELHRKWAWEVMGVKIERPYRDQRGLGLLGRLRSTLVDPATWRDLVWLLLNTTVGFVLVVLPAAMLLGVAWFSVLPLVFYFAGGEALSADYGLFVINDFGSSFLGWLLAAVCWLAFVASRVPLLDAYTRMMQWLLSPTSSAVLGRRVEQLTEIRAETIEAQAAELRRIERDLHDGAQARLVSVGMNLGMAESLIPHDPEAAQALLGEAVASNAEALTELRNLVRGVHPPVLADRGLDGAVRAIAIGSAIPVDIAIELPGRPPSPVESAAYFAIAEALTNIIKHSHATTAWIRLSYNNSTLCARVSDNGRGGATRNPGGGLHGIERRLAAFDGKVSVSSPLGGPTVVTMELPCALSSQKISPSSGTV